MAFFFFNGITALEYGRPVNTVRKVQKFISKLGLCQSHLSRDYVNPICPG